MPLYRKVAVRNNPGRCAYEWSSFAGREPFVQLVLTQAHKRTQTTVPRCGSGRIGVSTIQDSSFELSLMVAFRRENFVYLPVCDSGGVQKRPRIEHAARNYSLTSSVTTWNFSRVCGPKTIVIGTSPASRPRPMTMRPMRADYAWGQTRTNVHQGRLRTRR
jgi:hypothetical protein